MKEDTFCLLVSISLLLLWPIIFYTAKMLAIKQYKVYKRVNVALETDRLDLEKAKVKEFDEGLLSFRRQKLCLEQLLKSSLQEYLGGREIPCGSRIEQLQSALKLLTNITELSMEQNIRQAKHFRDLFKISTTGSVAKTEDDPITALNNSAVSRRWGTPQYELLQYKGGFVFKVFVNGKSFEPTEAIDKKRDAKRKAAELALKSI